MIIPDSRRAEWNALVASYPHGDVLQTWEWGELKSRTGWEPLPLGLLCDDQLCACCLVLKRPLPLGRSLLYAPRGPLVDFSSPDLWPALAAELKTLALHHRALAVKLDPALDHTNELAHRALLGQGFNPVSSDEAVGGVQPKHVMKLDLTSSLDDLLASFHSKWRYNIRYAARQGVEVTADTTRADIEPFYRLLQETASRDGFTVRALSYFYDLWDILVERGMGRLFLAHADGQLLAGTLAFLLPPQAWYVYGASSNEKRNLMPNHAIQWAMIQWAHDNGCTTYDFRGVAPQIDGEPQGPLAGLNRFKAGFNAHYVEYLGEYEWVARPLSHWAFRKALPWVRARGRRHRRAESED